LKRIFSLRGDKKIDIMTATKMNKDTELTLLRHIVKTYGHLDFDEIKDDVEYMDCVMMEHGIRDEDQEGQFFKLAELKREHYMFRAFFDKKNVWYDWYVENYEPEYVGVKKEFDLETELN
jgi:hypothetical protein